MVQCLFWWSESLAWLKSVKGIFSLRMTDRQHCYTGFIWSLCTARHIWIQKHDVKCPCPLMREHYNCYQKLWEEPPGGLFVWGQITSLNTHSYLWNYMMLCCWCHAKTILVEQRHCQQSVLWSGDVVLGPACFWMSTFLPVSWSNAHTHVAHRFGTVRCLLRCWDEGQT